MKMKFLSHVRLLANPWTAAYQAPPSLGFSRQEYWSGVPSPSLHWGIVVYNKMCPVEVNSLMNFDGWTTPCNTAAKRTRSTSTFSENSLHPESPHSLLRQAVIKLIPNLLFMFFFKKKIFFNEV